MKQLILFSLCLTSLLAKPNHLLGYKSLRNGIGGRLIGGVLAEEGLHPYHVGIRINPYVPIFAVEGSGALVSHRAILTVASLVAGFDWVQISIGSDDLEAGYLINATNIKVHEDYNETTLENDIAIILLDQPLTLNESIQLIPLSGAVLEAETPITITGWGAEEIEVTSLPGGILQETVSPIQLNKLDLKIISNEDCQSVYGDVIKESMVCAVGEHNEGACVGDSGDPAVDSDGNLVAVVSFASAEGCLTPHPSGLTRIFPYIDWILSNI